MEFRIQADEDLYNRLIECGLREYSAKIYVALFGMGVASATELHEFTKIPRGRVYETLTYLEEKQFVCSSGSNPTMYRVEDIHRTFSVFQNDQTSKSEILYSSLLELDALHHPVRFPLNMVPILTEEGIEEQFRMMYRRAKSEIVILCNDAELLKRFSGDLHRVRKKVDVEVIVSKPEMAKKLSLPCYMVKDTVDKSLFYSMGSDNQNSILLQIFIDRRNMFIICNNDERMNGFYSQDILHKEFMITTLLQNVTRIKYVI
ncbi:hypothetical protein L0665_02090 [Methanogenium marinum]|uniref:Transcription regulator TrmB N-terminal domain-containing protein n=1 Tax=Methanogenium marinum TaxID=348610 RepID=A0A9Q4KRZ1_9EURY|nr:helix-turn-helix domain-containing protein [Methanogenium marinum]MDE4907411.1 hypothetical protein [Methanogenium marinum]